MHFFKKILLETKKDYLEWTWTLSDGHEGLLW